MYISAGNYLILIWVLTLYTGSAVEGSVSVDADRVLDTAAIVDVTLVDVVADLPLPGSEVKPHAGEPSATWTRKE